MSPDHPPPWADAHHVPDFQAQAPAAPSSPGRHSDGLHPGLLPREPGQFVAHETAGL